MIGLIVQLTAEFAKIWSTSYRRFITYSRDDLPSGSHEGDWIEIEFSSSGVMLGMKKRDDLLETRRDERGKMQVVDIFIVDSRREEAYCEIFGVVKIERRKGGGKWIEERKIKDHCIHLWITTSSNAQFSIEEQSLDRANSKDGKYAEKYKRLMEGVNHEKAVVLSPMKDLSDECMEFDETILIVGFDHKTKRFFSSSRCGEAYINQSVWIGPNQDKSVEKGTSFQARIERADGNSGDALHRVVKLYARVDLWKGVRVNFTARDINVELNAVVVERRQTCFALATEPFGLVTYSLDKSFLRTDLNVGDHMRVIVHRYKDESKGDHPSKWKVTSIVEMLKKPGNEKSEEVEYPEAQNSTSRSNHGVEEPEEFNETILIVGFDERSQRFFSSSSCGEAVIPLPVWKKQGEVKLGDVFLASLCRISDPGVEFRVLNLKKRMDVWKGVNVRVVGKDVRAELTGKVVERRQTCFVLDTIPFGLIAYPLDSVNSLPDDIQIGDQLLVGVIRLKKYMANADYPSKWQVKKVKNILPASVENKGEWFEGIVTCISGSRVFISFKHGNAMYNRTINVDLPLGTIVDICVRDTGSDSFFDVCDIDSRTRTRDDIKVEKNEEVNRAVFTVTCPAEVIERRDGYFLLDTPIIGLAQFFFGECPDNMRVGQIWDVKMHRRKEKRDFPSHWVVHEVVNDSPRSTVMDTSKQSGGQRRKGGWEKEEEFPSTTRSGDDSQWGTVIITGSKDGDWFGSCCLSDTITIPHSLVRNLKIPKRGSFYRIKCSLVNERWKAYDLKPDPVYPKYVEIFGDVDQSLQVWCYATIERSDLNSFTIYNELLGEATLPHKFADPKMKVGDEIEALYYRVKTTKNPTHWMVQLVKVLSLESKRSRDTERRMNENEGRREENTNDVYSEKTDPSLVSSKKATLESSPRQEIRRQKDRRVLENMRHFLTLPEIREMFNRGIPEELEHIDMILDRDRMRSQL